MNLENLNVTELNAQEKIETDGGILPLLLIGGSYVVEAVMVGVAAELLFNSEHYGQMLEDAVNDCSC